MNWGTVSIIGALVAFVQGIALMVARRWFDRRDREFDDLRKEMNELKDRRVGLIENKIDDVCGDMKRGFEAAAMARRSIHQDIAGMTLRYTPAETLRQEMNRMQEQLNGYHSSVVELGRVSERVDATAKRCEQLTEQQISLLGKLERMQGQLSAGKVLG